MRGKSWRNNKKNSEDLQKNTGNEEDDRGLGRKKWGREKKKESKFLYRRGKKLAFFGVNAYDRNN